MDEPTIPPDVKLMPRQACPVCKYPMTAIGTGDGSAATPPTPGDRSVCMRCVVVLVFDADLVLHVMSNAEWARLSVDERRVITQMRQKIQHMHTVLGPPVSSEL